MVRVDDLHLIMDRFPLRSTVCWSHPGQVHECFQIQQYPGDSFYTPLGRFWSTHQVKGRCVPSPESILWAMEYWFCWHRRNLSHSAQHRIACWFDHALQGFQMVRHDCTNRAMEWRTIVCCKYFSIWWRRFCFFRPETWSEISVWGVC
jgi:hypothetical protein